MGFRRVSVNWRQRLWAGRGVGTVVGLAVYGIAGTVATMYIGAGNTIEPLWAIIGIAGPAAVGVVTALARGQMKSLPPTICDDLAADVPYQCNYCTSRHLEEACELTRPYYGREFVAGTVAEHWRATNPKGFVEILNNSGELCACFGILALTESFNEQFMAGRVSDTQMGPDCILGPEESRKANHLYISGVVVRSPEAFAGRKRVWVMMWAILVYLKKVYGFKKHRTLFAIAANSDSEKLMKNLGFILRMEAGQRTDKCPLYTYELSKDGYDNLLARIGDMSPMCQCAF